MADESQVQKALSAMAIGISCRECGTRIRFGDLDCPHCGADLDDLLWLWAENLLNELGLNNSAQANG